jgi:hypothetical protein
MSNPATFLNTLVAFCSLAFLGFLVASFLEPTERGVLQASATAFLVGTALALASLRSHIHLSRRLNTVEQRIASGDKPGPG